MTTPAQAPAVTEQGLRRVGLWGAAAELGKSTFLSALFIAAMRSSDDLRVKGRDDESTDFLVRNTHALDGQHQFPGADNPAAGAELDLPDVGAEPSPRPGWRKGAPTVPLDFHINLQDTAGRACAAVPGVQCAS